MIIDTDTMVSMTEANQNFSKVARMVDEKGSAVIIKNNMPKYWVIDFNRAEEEGFVSDEAMLYCFHRLMKYQNRLDSLVQLQELKKE